jgi:glycosidase
MHSSSHERRTATGRGALGILSVTFLALAGCGAALEAPRPIQVRLDERSGDAWTFARTVSGAASEGCSAVAIQRGPFVLRAPVEDGRFSAVVPLAPGENVVDASCAVPAASSSSRAVFQVRLPDTPRAAVRVASIDEAITLDAAGTPNGGTDAPVEAFRWSADPSNPAALVTTEGSPLEQARGARVSLATPPRDGEYLLWLDVTDAAGKRDRAGLSLLVEHGVARAIDRTSEPPAWLEDAVVYGVVPFLFGDPAFDAVTARLPKLAELGVNTLWLSPIFESPDGDFGYAVDDYFAVRDEWGTTESLRRMIDRAHALGMKVVLDFVPNHTSADHRYFTDAEQHGERSPYWDFYERDADGEPTHYFDWEHLPNLDYDNPEVRRWMTEAFSYWTRELDVDGFRVDVAWGVLERAPDFFDALREELVRIEPNVLLLAEASAADPSALQGGFDAAYDWTTEVGHWSWRDVFADGAADVPALARALEHSEPRVLRFLDNNDTGARFLTRHGPELERVASAMLFTLPGIPALFTGQELGAEYEPYQREAPLALTPDPERFARYQALARLRATEPALSSGSFVPLEVIGAPDVYAFARVPAEGRPVVVALGFGRAPTEARIRLTPELAERLDGRRPDALLGGPPTLERGELRVHLAPHDARIWAFE